MQAIRAHSSAPLGFAAAALAALALTACASERRRDPSPAATQAPRPVETSTPRPAATPADWRDMPITAGNWFYRPEATGSAALFGPPQSEALFAVRCERAGAAAIVLARAGAAQGPVPFTLVTTSRAQSYSAAPAGDALPTITVRLSPRDPMLDALAFSRGRFAIEAAGLPTLYVPAWPEVARVVEDCRRG